MWASLLTLVLVGQLDALDKAGVACVALLGKVNGGVARLRVGGWSVWKEVGGVLGPLAVSTVWSSPPKAHLLLLGHGRDSGVHTVNEDVALAVHKRGKELDLRRTAHVSCLTSDSVETLTSVPL